ncbi:Pycsar system effector family protein [Mucilaginibacter sp. AK015]|uniref:Pycsar system effector family protein n=1 Tax=Mucilaginibacter sp. AK015 TaxID=2723072 RepID=UPI00161B2AA5|nr:Pycsar system effector family protein [Mucilaginibacter sp. AK015]MBB5394985.1 putative metal-dependent HD superfamily phosphohydrolase [Mucilaginibacter sp. AK015]
MKYPELLRQIREYALAYYKTHADAKLVYHDKAHTEGMVAAAAQIGNHYQLTDRDFFIVQAAAWFHDLGYMVDIAHHEAQSAVLAENFLRKHDADEADIEQIKNCILATQMPQNPVTLLDKIVCDADLFHLGTDDFFKTDKRLLKEIRALYHKDISKTEWRRKSLKFLEDHRYHTDYCQVLLSSGKQANIQALKSKIAAAEEKEAQKPAETMQGATSTPTVAANEEKKKKADRPDKGIETMFRISSGNHQRLSDMADNKAHIMITVNSIILSAIISLLLRKLTEYEYLIIPTFILLSISLLAMTFSILATRPSIPPGIFQRADVDEKRVNLLFFGNFYKMPLEDYTYGMVKMMDDKDFLYGSLIKDVYAQGVVLGKKYRLLRVAYNIFMFGLIAAVIAFIIASAVYNSNGHH